MAGRSGRSVIEIGVDTVDAPVAEGRDIGARGDRCECVLRSVFPGEAGLLVVGVDRGRQVEAETGRCLALEPGEQGVEVHSNEDVGDVGIGLDDTRLGSGRCCPWSRRGGRHTGRRGRRRRGGCQRLHRPPGGPQCSSRCIPSGLPSPARSANVQPFFRSSCGGAGGGQGHCPMVLSVACRALTRGDELGVGCVR